MNDSMEDFIANLSIQWLIFLYEMPLLSMFHALLRIKAAR